MFDSLTNDILKTLQSRKISSLDSVEKSKAFCMKPWVHLFVSHFGTVAPCCITPWEKEQALGDVNEETIQQIWNGKPMRELRIKMLKDEKDSRCWQCHENERMGLLSDRVHTNFHHADKLDWAVNTRANGFSEESKPVYWDIRISNLCNFKCRICSHDSSSQWYEDAKALGLFTYKTKLNRGTKDFERLLEQLEFVIPDLEEVYFAGGEPLIMEEHYRLLNKLIEKGKTNIRLQYNTNFSQTHFKGQDLFELWAKFENIHVLASLDGSSRRGELQRHGQDWSLAISNRQRMMRVCPHAQFMVAPTISVFNVFHLPDFHREWTEKGLIHVDEFMPHSLKHPPEYNIRILPENLKKQAEEKISKHIEWIVAYAKQNPPVEIPLSKEKFEKIKDRLHWIKKNTITGFVTLDIIINEFQSCITYMNSSDESHLIPKFKEMSTKLDHLRGENTAQIFPELAVLLT